MNIEMNEPHGIGIHGSSHHIEIWPFIFDIGLKSRIKNYMF
jgi:hypothetical protein